MADNNDNMKMPRPSFGGMVTTVRPTNLGKKAPDLAVSVKSIGRQLFAVEAGKVKVPRKRQTSTEWPEWFETLKAPQMLYFYFEPGVDQTEDNAIPVAYDEAAELFFACEVDEDGAPKLAPAIGDDGSPLVDDKGEPILAVVPVLDENGKRQEFTGDNVAEMAAPDGREVESTMEGLQKLRNAITRFNNKTGKQLATRFVKAQRDSSGRTLRQTEVVYRLK